MYVCMYVYKLVFIEQYLLDASLLEVRGGHDGVVSDDLTETQQQH